MRRLSYGVGAVLLAALALAPADSAFAHNGVGAAFKGRAGSYIVYAYDGDQLPGNRIDYRLVVLNGKTKNPVYGVHPSATASRPGAATAAATITTFGNVFFYNLPNPYPHDWDIHLRLTGRLGRAQVSYRMHGFAVTTAEARHVVVDTHSGSTEWPIIGGVLGGAVVLAGLGYVTVNWRARRQRPAR